MKILSSNTNCVLGHQKLCVFRPLGHTGTLFWEGKYLLQWQEINFRVAYYAPQTLLMVAIKLEAKGKRHGSCLI